MTADEAAEAVEAGIAARVHRRVHRNVQESRAPDGSPVRQQVLHNAWLALSRGPLAYATGLIDGYKPRETVRLPDDDALLRIEELAPAEGVSATGLRLHFDDRAPLDFGPWYAVGGRRDRSWRLTWLHLAPSPDGFADDDCGTR